MIDDHFTCGDCDPCLAGRPEQCIYRCAIDHDPTPHCAVCRAHTAADCHCPPDADFVDAVERLKEERKS